MSEYLVSNDLFGAKTAVVGQPHPRPGEVLVLLRNGRPVRVIETGARIKRVFNAPLTGNLEAIPVALGPVEVQVRIAEVVLRDAYRLPEVVARLKIQLTGGRGFNQLLKRIEDEGERFTVGIDTEMQNEIQKLIRSEFLRHDHKDIYGTSLVGNFDHTFLVLDRLFRVEVRSVEAIWDPVFVGTIDTIKRARREHAETAVDLAAEQRRQTVERSAMGFLAEKADEFGISMAEAADPELLRLKLTHDAAFKIAFLERIKDIRRDPEILQAVLQLAFPNNRQIEMPGRAVVAGTLELGPVTVRRIATPQLAIDDDLLDLLEDHGQIAHHVRGLTAIQHGGNSYMLMVLNDEPSLAIPPQFAVTGEASKAFAIKWASDLSDFVSALVERLQPDLHALDLHWSSKLDGNRLVLELVVNNGDARVVRRAIVKPESLVIQALEALLPFEEVAVTPAYPQT